ncbi:MAG: lysine--tRNA ligase, partial [Halobacteriales archaeon]|nr:lysine--tRNA ligase [Halobacteriales archaeon]
IPTTAGEPADAATRTVRRRFLDEVFADRVRLPYTFAAVLGMTDDRDLRIEMAQREGHLTDETPAWAVEKALDRVERARHWAERMDNEYNYRLQSERPDVSVDADMNAALEELATVVESDADGDEIQGRIYEIARDHDLDVGAFFSTGYRLFLGQSDGPRLGPFLGALDRQFVAARLRREG